MRSDRVVMPRISRISAAMAAVRVSLVGPVGGSASRLTGIRKRSADAVPAAP
jgi:hypothetical protein